MEISTDAGLDLGGGGSRSASPPTCAAVRESARPGQEILLVVKADAYGHGAVEIAEAAEREGVDPSRRGHAARGHPAPAGRAAACRSWRCRRCCRARSDEAVAHELSPTVCDLDFARALSDGPRARGAAGCATTSRSTPAWAAPASRVDEAEAFLARPGDAARAAGWRASTRTSRTPTPRTSRSRASRCARFQALLERLGGARHPPPRRARREQRGNASTFPRRGSTGCASGSSPTATSRPTRARCCRSSR